ncbi:MAG: hypothetical protein ACRELB_06530 [Polyangiaceae bacterium]
MTTAETTPQDDAPEPAAARRPPPAPESPGLAAGWLLRTVAIAAVAAGAMGLIVAPGVRGIASERVVDGANTAAAVLGYFVAALLVALVIWASFELVRARGPGFVGRSALVVCGAAVTVLAAFGFRDHVEPLVSVLLVAFTTVAAIASATPAARAPHTRALAAVLFALAFAGVARLGAWEFAMAAGERASVKLYGFSRVLATAGVVFEAMAQLVAVTWLGTRSKLAGQVGATAALVGAFVLTWGVARGVHSGAAPWEAVLHTALADAPGVPPPYGLDAVATFLVHASMLLALVSASQPGQVVALVATMGLALMSRGAFDAPLRGLCGVAAALWAALACQDERAMWRTLIDDRRRKLDEESV